MTQSIRILPGGDQLPSDPEMLRDYHHILAQAEAGLAARQESYPALVAAQRMSAAEAGADIAAWQALVAEWRWIATGEGAPPSPATLFDRIAAVDLALDRVGALLARNRHNPERQRQRDLLLAMRWHLSHLKYGDPEVHFWASLTIKARAQRACGVCERLRTDPATHACTRTDCGLAGARPLPTTTERNAA